MKTYNYHNSKSYPPLFFVAIAENILEADKQFLEALGRDPARMAHITVSFRNETYPKGKVYSNNGMIPQNTLLQKRRKELELKSIPEWLIKEVDSQKCDHIGKFFYCHRCAMGE